MGTDGGCQGLEHFGAKRPETSLLIMSSTTSKTQPRFLVHSRVFFPCDVDLTHPTGLVISPTVVSKVDGP